ncbi:hypothetical protein VFPPC_17438 [Pochonia chlamydosporia 170]|uniref:Uncharacterized protein n=1 Tax=Pochonia chlamydosporia 170 TaxID=1380566 RepID=A0A219ARM4_METCM|nr:hypothetical protein VFPPC_17438 [Pochonia chlamydosporia 170]OWT43413.1 hypothetical protein VFPPC_17438 [Pochonia chlamydosporia 170]
MKAECRRRSAKFEHHAPHIKYPSTWIQIRMPFRQPRVALVKFHYGPSEAHQATLGTITSVSSVLQPGGTDPQGQNTTYLSVFETLELPRVCGLETHSSTTVCHGN